ncbi:MAG: winged helix-turn-helix domain-containing protein [Fimbriimonadaceae bacterium]
MRGSEPLDILFTKARRQVLGTLLLDARRAWSLTDIAKRHGTTPSTLQRELAMLQAGGLVLRCEVGGKVLYRANAGCACFPELQALFVREFSLGDLLRETLGCLPIRYAFVYGPGVWAESAVPIPLVVVSNIRADVLDSVLRPLEVRLGKQIEAALLTEVAFAERMRGSDYFLRFALEAASLHVLGDDFAAAA